ncbi:PIR protein [Plasmodium vivax]|uniref:VIR protein n=1 Tax=Plasmodium vivax TaxID=5855 RepID=A0A564ZS74_PLAVI|nr:PIR protein [Plasmodium vivax]
MAQCKSGSDTYLNHACYKYLNDTFKNNNVSESSLEYFNKIYVNFENENELHSKYRPLFLEIISHITKDPVFMEADPRIPCKFVNYLLNYQLRRTEYQYHNISNYDNYKKVLKDFYTKRFGRYYPDNACVDHIKDIEEVIFKRMEILYQLYNQFDGIKKTNENYDSTACNNLSRLASLFNDTANNHGTQDSELLERLKDLKNLIGNKISSPNYNTCDTKAHFFRLPETSSTVHEKQGQDLTREKGQQESELKSPELLPKAHGTVSLLPENLHVSKETEVPEVIAPSRGQETVTTSRELHHTPGSVSLNPWESEKETRISEHRTPYISGNFNGLGHSLVQGPRELYTLIEDENGNTEGGINLPGHRRSNAAAKEEGVSGILSSISGVLGGVDPVPVVGVSGGMGALFLLFRYTPVGTFFRGRRGRTYGIPSGFSGPFPGEFPGYQDYLGANIGYSQMNHLAE